MFLANLRVNIWVGSYHDSKPDRYNRELSIASYHDRTKPTTNKSVIVSTIIHDDVMKWKLFPRCWPFVRGVHLSPVNSTHKGQWRRALMFSFICARINVWVNNRGADDLRRHRAHYDVIVMYFAVITRYTRHWSSFRITHTVPLMISFDILLLLAWRSCWPKSWWRHQGTHVTSYNEGWDMRMPSNGNIFRVTGLLCGEFTGHPLIPRTKASDAELWCFLWSTPEYTTE